MNPATVSHWAESLNGNQGRLRLGRHAFEKAQCSTA